MKAGCNLYKYLFKKKSGNWGEIGRSGIQVRSGKFTHLVSHIEGFDVVFSFGTIGSNVDHHH